MCYGCYEEAGEPAIINEATQAAAALVAKVYEFSMVGGNAHIVVDDWNLEDSHIRWCLDTALTENAHEAGKEQIAAEKACLEALLALNPAERASVMALHDGFIDPVPPNTGLSRCTGGESGKNETADPVRSA